MGEWADRQTDRDRRERQTGSRQTDRQTREADRQMDKGQSNK